MVKVHVTGKIVHRTEKLVQAVTVIPAKAVYAAWSSEQVFLSLSHNGYLDVSLYKRDLMKDEDKNFEKDFAQQLSEEHIFANFILSF